MRGYRVPYRDAFSSGSFRPYLMLHVTAPSGKNGSILGLVDSGADMTCLPFGYAALMGYGASELKHEDGHHAAGSMDLWSATTPCVAFVVGLPEVTFDLHPTFVQGNQSPLWGRRDFFGAFQVLFDETAQEFSLLLP